MGKIIDKHEFAEIRRGLKEQGKTVVLCHGVFDLVHPGHMLHFKEAKSLGNVLVVSVTSEKFVRKGPGRPYFNDELRMSFLSGIEYIDYVVLSEDYTVLDIIESVEPDIYVKGQEYSNSENDITGKIDEEAALVRSHGGEVHFTGGRIFSSTQLINRALPSLSAESKDFLQVFRKNYAFQQIKDYIDRFKALKILVVGDVIIDEYIYCSIKGLMSKDMGYSACYKRTEQHLGGALAIARHLSAFSDNVTVSSIIGKENDIHSLILNDISGVMRTDFEYDEDFDTIVKKRYITENEKREELHKIFAVNNLADNNTISLKYRNLFINKIKENVKEFDLVVLCDFGHGLIDRDVMDIVQNDARMLTVNCQTNSSNYGMNLITKYKKADAFTLDQKELHLAMGTDRKGDLELLGELEQILHAPVWLTRGANGSMCVCEGQTFSCPALTLDVIDTIGAGDAFFSLVSLCAAVGAPAEVANFMGNVGGALAANIVGNREAIQKVNVLKFINTLLNI